MGSCGVIPRRTNAGNPARASDDQEKPGRFGRAEISKATIRFLPKLSARALLETRFAAPPAHESPLRLRRDAPGRRQRLGVESNRMEVTEATPEELSLAKELRAKLKDAGVVSKEEEMGSGTFKLADDNTLVRFLRARDLKVEKAFKMLKAAVEWRNKMMPSLIKMEDLAPALRDSGLYRYVGRNKAGYDVMLSQSTIFDPNMCSVEEYIKYVIFTNERQAAMHKHQGRDSLKEGREVWIFDLNGWNMSHAKPKANKMVNSLISIAQDYYPETLQKSFVINAPWLFNAAWKVISPWLDKNTKAKVQFCKPAVLLETIDAEVLHERYGGARKAAYDVHHIEYPIPAATTAADAQPTADATGNGQASVTPPAAPVPEPAPAAKATSSPADAVPEPVQEMVAAVEEEASAKTDTTTSSTLASAPAGEKASEVPSDKPLQEERAAPIATPAN
ncbi:Phosphatidylinositol/phosphatidylcholine transfer protein SFH1 (Phosphatidylinositol transfer protein 1) (AtPITP1) (Protein CAN OF WORMS1) (Protein SEC FOURTEEN HOMOLOGS 1) (AtSFH1) (Protein SHORT ROOT HAIR 1) [Durusdinium trenchii]|uniref:CRAL-TRIO domain-containing protein n=1 Tax=Durusdinium trenchii TaxID=1381693 RepID=A0ABP0K7Z7_9DINO